MRDVRGDGRDGRDGRGSAPRQQRTWGTNSSISELYQRLQAEEARPQPDYYSFNMNGQKREWETVLTFKIHGKSVRSIGRGFSKFDAEHDAAERALDKYWKS